MSCFSSIRYWQVIKNAQAHAHTRAHTMQTRSVGQTKQVLLKPHVLQLYSQIQIGVFKFQLYQNHLVCLLSIQISRPLTPESPVCHSFRVLEYNHKPQFFGGFFEFFFSSSCIIFHSTVDQRGFFRKLKIQGVVFSTVSDLVSLSIKYFLLLPLLYPK